MKKIWRFYYFKSQFVNERILQKKAKLGGQKYKSLARFSFNSDSLLWRVKMPFIFKRQMDLGSRF